MIKSFPKIFTLGQDYIRDIFKHEVEITEKIDGSQFDFGKIGGELICRSKGQQQYTDNPDKMFKLAVDYVISVQDKMPDNFIFYCEYLENKKHNILNYDRTPKNNLILFGVCDLSEKFISEYDELKLFADFIGIETVPLIYRGNIESVEEILKFLDRDSVLGGIKIEGVVVKNYSNPFLLGDQLIPLMAGKFVSEKFKETHREKWGGEFTSKGKWELFKECFRTEARWLKAIQHLKETGQLDNSPKDIGKLIKEIQTDVEEEEKETIKEFLWVEMGREVIKKSFAGFPEFYKEYLLKNNFYN